MEDSPIFMPEPEEDLNQALAAITDLKHRITHLKTMEADLWELKHRVHLLERAIANMGRDDEASGPGPVEGSS